MTSTANPWSASADATPTQDPLVLAWSDTRERKRLRAQIFNECFGASAQEGLNAWRGHEVWRSFQSEKRGACALGVACFQPCDPAVVLPFLLEEGLDPGRADRTGRTPLHAAALGSRRHRLAWMEALLAAGADPLAEDQEGLTPLAMALRSGQASLVQALLDHGARPSPADHRAALATNNLETLALFWGHFGPPASQQARTQAFIEAAHEGCWNRARALMAHGVDVHAQAGGRNAVLMACDRSRPPMDLIRELVGMGVDPMVADDGGLGALAIVEKANAFNAKRRERNVVRVSQAIAAGREARLEGVLEGPAPPEAVARRPGRL